MLAHGLIENRLRYQGSINVFLLTGTRQSTRFIADRQRLGSGKAERSHPMGQRRQRAATNSEIASV